MLKLRFVFPAALMNSLATLPSLPEDGQVRHLSLTVF